MSKFPEKLSSVAAKQIPFFGGAPTNFLGAFPTVAKISVTVHEHSVEQEFEPEVFDETDIPPIIDCRNPRCWEGGVRLQPLLREAISEICEQGKTDFEKSLSCCGHEGTRTKSYRRCYNSFVIKGHVELKK